MNIMKEIECIVTGRVQLVLFRDFTQRKAWGLGLSGFVKNLPDGSVRVVAQGEEEALKRFIKELKKGSLLSRVDNVSVLLRDSTNQYEGFTILY